MITPVTIDPVLAARELKRRERERPCDFWQFMATKAQLAVHKDKKRKRVALGGNRSGKSRVGATECIWAATGTHPFREWSLPMNIWAVGVDFPTLRDGIKKEYFDRLLPRGEYRYYVGDMIYEITKGKGRGSIIGLKSCDSGREKFQSVTRDLIWMDEEPPEEVFNECLARILDCNGDMLLTYTPLQGMSWSYRRLFLNEPGDPEVSIHRFRTIDNPLFKSAEEAKQRISTTYSGVSAAELEARLEGMFIPLAGRPVFDRLRLADLRNNSLKGIRGDIRNVGLDEYPRWEFRAEQ